MDSTPVPADSITQCIRDPAQFDKLFSPAFPIVMILSFLFYLTQWARKSSTQDPGQRNNAAATSQQTPCPAWEMQLPIPTQMGKCACGANLTPADKFCGECGKEVPPAQEEPTEPEQRFSSLDEDVDDNLFDGKCINRNSRAAYAGLFVYDCVRRGLVLIGSDKLVPELIVIAFEVVVAIYFGMRRQYLPGCLYNNLHVILTRRKFVPAFESKSGRFSGTKKFLLGVTGYYTIFGFWETVLSAYCIATQDDKSGSDWGWFLLDVIAMVLNAPAVVKTVPVVVVFYVFSLFALFACPFRLGEQHAYSDAQSKFTSGHDHRGLTQKFGSAGCFSTVTPERMCVSGAGLEQEAPRSDEVPGSGKLPRGLGV
eukprot:CAMPEP_0177694756 /NCGR_PEP_ID=MMETSP0484_2-20121128/3099_1 /TAXON_ID=354590 /ORGANISM="Rhodomonas lens, Strain RHODO" /LENGTH=367 /DNA_ID=CAMNT_0019205647 /DNA_START=27 /DNA_END=1131 /DNA_ORIENTATION=+